VFELPLPMPVRRVLADDRVDANRGKVALQRGPLVYCVEEIDHFGRRTDALVLPDNAKLYVESSEGFLGGLRILTADGAIARESAWGAETVLRPIKLTAIPYYAWANRGDGYMDVWLARSAEHATPLPAKTAANEAKVSSSSAASDKVLESLRDGRHGPASDHRETPRFAWADTKGGSGWIEYQWTEPRELSRTSVHWAVDRRAQVYWGKRIRGADLALPKSWRILYRDGGSWKPVEPLSPEGDPYTLRLDLPNQVRFEPVDTTALRLEVEFADSPSAVQEWKVD
jgi:hypothetical protein